MAPKITAAAEPRFFDLMAVMNFLRSSGVRELVTQIGPGPLQFL